MSPTLIPLSQLVPDDASNVRKTDVDAELDVLIGSIKKKGIITALTVRTNGQDGKYLITAGRRRYRALMHLLHQGLIGDHYPVPVLIREEDDAEARDTNLTSDITPMPLHPVDRYEAFAELIAAGKSVTDVGTSYGLTDRQVHQSLALAAIAPEIRDAWRHGRVNAETAQAFTIEPDVSRQVKVFKKLTKGPGPFYLLNEQGVRRDLVGDRSEAGHLVEFVGTAAYENAGGKVTPDLFRSLHVISNSALAKKLADEKLDAECKRFVEELGWSWALPSTAPEYHQRYSWHQVPAEIKPTKEDAARLEAIEREKDEVRGDRYQQLEYEQEAIEAAMRLRGFNDKDRAKSGVFLSVGRDGKLQVEAGYVRPAAKKETAAPAADVSKKKKAKDDGEEETTKVSNALAHRLSRQLTDAVADVVRADPDIAMVLAVTGLSTYNSCVGLTNATGQGRENALDREEFDDVFPRILKMTTAARLKAFANLVACAINMQTHHADRVPLDEEGDAAMICAWLDPKKLNAAIRRTFDGADYFESISKAGILSAIAETSGRDAIKELASKPKADLVAYATTHLVKAGWLPHELRAPSYDGPGAKPATTKKTAKKKAR